MSEKQKPHSYEAECATLGSMILETKVIPEVMEIVAGPEDFYSSENAAVYEALVELAEGDSNVDIVKLRDHLADKGLLESVGGSLHLMTLCESTPYAMSGPQYAATVRDKALSRNLIEGAENIIRRAYESGASGMEQLEAAEADVFSVAQSTESRRQESVDDVAKAMLKDWTEGSPGEVTGLPTGFVELDEMTTGLQPGELVILAARPSMGKTALALNIAENIAIHQGTPTAFFSMEMSTRSLVQRMICSMSGADSHRMRRNDLGEDDLAEIAQSVGHIGKRPIRIDDTPNLTMVALRSKARRMVAQNGVRFLVIDYLQLMTADGYESRQQEVTHLSMSIKALARELDVPVLCLSQLNRGVEHREGHRPRMSDLRESGSIEQDADVVLMLHREDYYHRDEPDYEDEKTAELIVAKQRNGPTGSIPLRFDGRTTRFSSLD